MRSVLSALAFLPLVIASHAAAQGTEVAFGGLRYDAGDPVEVTADALRVDQDSGNAVFSGNVVVVQGDLRMAAEEIRVEYLTGEETSGEIDRLVASGGVTLASGADAAEGQDAVYDVDDALLTVSGSVILTQGQSAVSGDRLVLNLEDGTGVMEGRVRTILQTGGDQ